MVASNRDRHEEADRILKRFNISREELIAEAESGEFSSYSNRFTWELYKDILKGDE